MLTITPPMRLQFFEEITTYITPKQRKSSSITCKTNLIRLILNTALKVGYFLEIFYRLKLYIDSYSKMAEAYC
jgi:hypothetical protein